MPDLHHTLTPSAAKDAKKNFMSFLAQVSTAVQRRDLICCTPPGLGWVELHRTAQHRIQFKSNCRIQSTPKGFRREYRHHNCAIGTPESPSPRAEPPMSAYKGMPLDA